MAYVSIAPHRHRAGLGQVGIDFSLDWKATGYLGLNLLTDELTKALAKTGPPDASAMAQYGQIAGAAGAAAACAATGAGALVAGACVAIGGTMGKILAGSIGKATTGSTAFDAARMWNEVIVPITKAAQQGTFALRAYLINRDSVVDEAAKISGGDRFTDLKWASEWLSARGIPPAPVKPIWDPSNNWYATRWKAFEDVWRWVSYEAAAPDNGPFGLVLAKPRFAGDVTERILANQLGLNLSTVVLLMNYPTGIPSVPGAPIDWGLVGATQAALTLKSALRLNVIGSGYCVRESKQVVEGKTYVNPGFCKPAGSYLAGKLANYEQATQLQDAAVKAEKNYAAGGGGTYSLSPDRPIIPVKASELPSAVAVDLNLALMKARPEIIVAAQARLAARQKGQAFLTEMEKYKVSKIVAFQAAEKGVESAQRRNALIAALVLLGGAATAGVMIYRRRRA